jgi:hypothetical protein
LVAAAAEAARAYLDQGGVAVLAALDEIAPAHDAAVAAVALARLLAARRDRPAFGQHAIGLSGILGGSPNVPRARGIR